MRMERWTTSVLVLEKEDFPVTIQSIMAMIDIHHASLEGWEKDALGNHQEFFLIRFPENKDLILTEDQLRRNLAKLNKKLASHTSG